MSPGVGAVVAGDLRHLPDSELGSESSIPVEDEVALHIHLKEFRGPLKFENPVVGLSGGSVDGYSRSREDIVKGGGIAQISAGDEPEDDEAA